MEVLMIALGIVLGLLMLTAIVLEFMLAWGGRGPSKKEIKIRNQKRKEFYDEKMDKIKDLLWEWENVFRYQGETKQWIEMKIQEVEKLKEDWETISGVIVEEAWERREKSYKELSEDLNKVEGFYKEAQSLLEKDEVMGNKKEEFERICLTDPLYAVNHADEYLNEVIRSGELGKKIRVFAKDLLKALEKEVG